MTSERKKGALRAPFQPVSSGEEIHILQGHESYVFFAGAVFFVPFLGALFFIPLSLQVNPKP